MLKLLKLTAASAALLVFASVGAGATTLLDDPLHAFCSYPAPSCVDNGSITPVNNSSPSFGFTKSPDTGTGDFWLTVLIPDNVTGAATQSITINGTNTANTPVTGSLVGSGWTSGNLDVYLGLSASPQNPIGAFLPLTQQEDAGATGYQVYKFDFGNVTFGSSTDPTFSESYLVPAGAIITAFFDDPKQGWVATANSSALIETAGGGGSHNPGLPEPATLAFAGTALIGFAIARRRNRKGKASA